MPRLALVLALLLLAALPASAPAKAPPGDAFYTPPSPLPGKGHGGLIWARRLKGAAALRAGARNDLVLYRSTGVRGTPVAVSGTVSVPKAVRPRAAGPSSPTATARRGSPTRARPPATAPATRRTASSPTPIRCSSAGSRPATRSC